MIEDDLVAIVGIACRVPMAPNPESFWKLLSNGESAITEVPLGRRDSMLGESLAGLVESASENSARYGGFLDNIDLFDANFFDISPREAAAMDPQQRLMLELSWESLEDAGINPRSLVGSRTGVFFGVIRDDYAILQARLGLEAISAHTMTGLQRGIIANRVSYVLGLRGPSLAIDSGQSSSLVAVHMACASLRKGEADIALAAGVNLNIVPDSALSAMRFGGLSPDGRCFTFDARANGYVRGEGGGGVVLKRLRQARADGDPVYCVIRGSAVNNDGPAEGLTVPSQHGQEEVLRLACEQGGVDPAEVQYVELHGTGTRVGDPIEAAALGTVLGAARTPDSPLLVGSVKTNIGHLEGAAGIAGLLKVVLSIEHGQIPASLNFATANPEIPLDRLGLRVQRNTSPWPSQGRPPLAGVSSFGMGGTNCHVVVSGLSPAADQAGVSRPPATRQRLPLRTFQRQRHWLQPTNVEQPVPASGQDAAGIGRDLTRDGVFKAVRMSAAAVLGHATAETVDGTRTFKQLGLNSVTSVEFCERLAAATGMAVPASVVFDYPTPDLLGAHLLAEMSGRRDSPRPRASVVASSGEPIAIVAMSCRYPGGADTPEDLWRLAIEGVDAISPFPADRGWDLTDTHAIDGAAGTGPIVRGYPRQGGFLHDAAGFDAEFFGISPREALAMDPQQRVLLEVAWEAIERAGISPVSLSGSDTGVFVGVIPQEYGARLLGGPADLEGYLFTGGTTSVASGRVAYTLGLRGPAITVDTACSSSLVALHLAAAALRNGECDLALAGGITMMATEGMFAEFSRQGGLAPDGRCKPFAAAADGTNWAEGGGLVVLERLSAAQANGHPVLALVRGSAINQDGASNGLTAPNGPAQEQVIGQALASAGLGPADVDVVEAHGTGTALGDPIEARALISAYGRERTPDHPLWLGSVKSNIGHTQAGAGIAGVIKVVMSMRHSRLPATLHVDRPSPHVDWSAGTVRLATEPMAWPAAERPRRAGVSSFGISGTNAHVIIEEPPPAALASADGIEPGAEQEADAPVAWLLSARSGPALREQARRLRRHVAEHQGLRPADVGYSLATSRAVMEHRAVLVGTSREEFLERLDALTAGDIAQAVVPAADSGGTVFVFPGQGPHQLSMAAELIAESAVFRACLESCAEALAPYCDWPLMDLLRGAPGSPRLDSTDVAQPALFAVMVSLAELWRSLGVEPDAVVGHSQGEIAAAVVAGSLSLDDAARIVAVRSSVLTELAGRGAMVAVRLPADKVRPMLQHWRGRLDIAAVNGPSSIVVSGEPRAANEFIATCETEGIQARALAVDYASHGQQVEAIRDRFLDRLGPVSSRPPRIAFLSTVTGEPVTDGDLDAAYWYRNLRQVVQFERAASTLLSRGHGTFIEVSPHPVLAVPIQEIIDKANVDARFVGTLHRDDGGWRRMLISAAQAHAARSRVDWRALLPSGGRRVSLPTYAFQHKRYWLAPPRPAGDPARLGQTLLAHPILAAAIRRADEDGVLVTGRLSAADHPWLADHVVAGTALLPATAFADLARCVADHCGCDGIAELIMETPLPLPGRADVQLQVTVSSADDSGQRPMAIYSRHADGDPWTRHVRGLFGAEDSGQGGATRDDMARAWPPAGAVREDISQLYQELAEAGYEYGPAFSGLCAVWRLDSDIYAEACLPEIPDEGLSPESGFGIHPALLDAVLHAVIGRALAGGERSPSAIRLPFSFSGVRLSAAHGSVLRARISPVSGDTVKVVATDANGSVVARINRLTLRPVTAARITAAGRSASRELLRLDWVPVPSAPDAGAGPWVVVGADPLGVASLLDADSYPDLTKVVTGVTNGAPVPAVVVVTAVMPEGAALSVPAESRQRSEDVPAMVRELCAAVLGVLQQWLSASPMGESRLVVLTHGAVLAVPGDAAAGAGGLAGAAVWGLVRSAQTEEQGRFVLADVDGMTESLGALPAAVGSGEPQVAVRSGQVLAPRLGRAMARRVLSPAAGAAGWRLTVTGQGTLDGLALVEDQASSGPLRPGQVRMKVRAAGVNFRDVVVALGMMDPGDEAGIGIEGAGVVLETAGPVNGLAPGDRVMGLLPGGIGPVAVTDHRMLVRIPAGWPVEQAAGMPVVFLTVYEGLVELAGLRAGESVLVHAGAGGVGMAAIQLARHLGAEVFATASPAKWETLRSLGLDDAHIASSRSAGFEAGFRAVTGGRGVDVVLNSLTGELTDASLRLLVPSGRFIEMGKTDIRDPGQVAAAYRGVTYQVFDLMQVKPDGIARMFNGLMGLFEAGALRPLPVTAWDIREAGDAFRYMSQARHTGKVVLTLPQVLDADGPDTGGPVLVTGGTGTLGGLVACHLVAGHGVRELVLASRRGPGAPGAGRLAAELAGTGARVQVAACDAASRDEVAGLLTWAGRGRPLAGVVHCAGLLRDATVKALSQADLDQVLASKVDVAWHLHELTAEMDLRMFVTFSSVAGVLGTPGQGNYAAANAFLDALASWRRGHGQAGVSLAWGLWEQSSGMTGHLAKQDLARLRRAGLVPLSSARGLELFDAGVAGPDPAVVAAKLDTGMLAGQARSGMLPAVLRGLTGNPATAVPAPDAGGLADRLAGLDADGQRRLVLEMIQAQAAVVLGHGDPGAVEAGRAFRDMGFDSLTAVELRNRLAGVTGLRLPATVTFDCPAPVALAGYLLGRLRPAAPASSVDAELDRLEVLFAEMDANDVSRRKAIARMQHMIARLNSVDRNESSSDGRDVLAAKVGSATAEEVFDLIDREFLGD